MADRFIYRPDPLAAEENDPAVVCPNCGYSCAIPAKMIDALLGLPAKCGACCHEFKVTGNRISYP